MTDTRPLTKETRGRMFAMLDEDQRARMSRLLGRPIASRSELTEDDALAVIDALKAAQRRREIAAVQAGEA